MTTHSAAAEQKAIEAEIPERKSVVDDFAGYRALRRRVEDMENAGLDNPFFQPRDGVSLETRVERTRDAQKPSTPGSCARSWPGNPRFQGDRLGDGTVPGNRLTRQQKGPSRFQEGPCWH